MDLLNKIKQTIKKHFLIETGDRVLLGISGGPDSVALLDILFRLKKRLKFSLFLCHLNHCLRKEAEEEAHFVEELANSYSLPITIAKRTFLRLREHHWRKKPGRYVIDSSPGLLKNTRLIKFPLPITLMTRQRPFF